MLKLQTHPATDALIEMGYQPDIISLAMEESQNKSLEEILDLLLFRERHYQKVLRKQKEKGVQPKIKKKYSADEQPNITKLLKKFKNRFQCYSESDEDWIEEDLINREEPIEVTRIGFGQAPKSVKLGKTKIEPPKKTQTGPKNEEALPKTMTREATEHLDGLLQRLKDNNSKDVNIWINTLSAQLAVIRTENSEANKILQKYIVSAGVFPQILELKNQIFTVLNKVMHMKIKKNANLDVKKVEQAMLWIFEMQLMSHQQLESVLGLFENLCQRILYSPDPILEEKLQKCCSDVFKRLPPTWMPDHMMKTIEEKACEENGDLVEEKNDVDDDEKENREEDDQQVDDAIAELPEFMKNMKRVVEDCIICMEKTREIVFLPCCHFLTCSLCSPRVMKCPMCNKRIDKHLKIHWS